MAVTYQVNTGDGINSTLVAASVQLPDSGTTVNVAGHVQYPGRARVAITGSPLTAPSPPGSGSIFWNIQVNTITGAAAIYQSTVADPVLQPTQLSLPLLFGSMFPDPNNLPPAGKSTATLSSVNVIIFRQTITNSTNCTWSNTTSTTPNSF